MPNLNFVSSAHIENTLSNRERLERIEFAHTIPEKFLCVISQEIMDDPVSNVATPQQKYERANIERWLRGNSTDPITRRPLSITSLISDETLRNEIRNFVRRQESVYRDQSVSRRLQAAEVSEELTIAEAIEAIRIVEATEEAEVLRVAQAAEAAEAAEVLRIAQAVEAFQAVQAIERQTVVARNLYQDALQAHHERRMQQIDWYLQESAQLIQEPHQQAQQWRQPPLQQRLQQMYWLGQEAERMQRESSQQFHQQLFSQQAQQRGPRFR